MREALARDGHDVDETGSGAEAVRKLKFGGPYRLVVADLRLPDSDGLEIVAAARALASPPEVIVLTGHATVETAVEAMRRGARDFLEKAGFDLAAFRAHVERALADAGDRADLVRFRAAEAERNALDRLLGESEAMRRVRDQIARVAPTEATVLLTGESGTGKELAARAIHGLSARAGKAFFAANCAAFTETLIESELFGHEKGAFTGAMKEKPGYFELADGGTLLLDEIGEMPHGLQAKLLRVLESREFLRVGGTRPVKVDVRIVAATNRDPQVLVKEGTFREDLYYRLAVVTIHLPPLRERGDDVGRLASVFLREASARHGRRLVLAPAALARLRAHRWPGNVRELLNVIENAAITAPVDEIRAEDLPIGGPAAAPPGGEVSFPERFTFAGVEREAIREALRRHGGNRKRAAEALGIGLRTVHRKIKEYGLD